MPVCGEINMMMMSKTMTYLRSEQYWSALQFCYILVELGVVLFLI